MAKHFELLETIPYVLPKFASSLLIKPQTRLKLAMLPTPIHKWDLPGLPKDVQLYIKRDDLSGSTLSGNKVRKLEFLLADALGSGCRHIMTVGGEQSNHCRATAIAARQLGLEAHLFLRSDATSFKEVRTTGNLMLDRMCGANVHLVPKKLRFATDIWPKMEALAAEIKARTGESSYLIPVGGSNPLGGFGYLEAFAELDDQGILAEVDDIIMACGSGGTLQGLALANHLTGSKVRIHGVSVSDDAAYFHSHINDSLSQLLPKDELIKSEQIVNLVDGYKGLGYALSTREELDFIKQVAVSTGIILDRVYTGKAAFGMVNEINRNPNQFKGRRILFIHTGGIFGLFDGVLEDTFIVK